MPFGRRPTVDDRVKATGYLTAPSRMRPLPPLPPLPVPPPGAGATGPPPGLPPMPLPGRAPVRPGAGPLPMGIPKEEGSPLGGGREAHPLKTGDMGRECMSCEHYDMGPRECTLYGDNPRPDQVCDSFEAAKREAPEEEEQ